ncbi:hypothetical protein JS608_01948 [Bacillus amyloliquefaciens]|nr:hypothetical protein JS608_01948 [Bacillus amyloliquefaciens]
MKFENSGLEGVTAELSRLNDLMEGKGLILAGQWDYERVTYDKKFSVPEGHFICGFKERQKRAMSAADGP